MSLDKEHNVIEEVVDEWMCQSKQLTLGQQLEWLRNSLAKCYRKGVNDGEEYQKMSNNIQNSKAH